MYDYVKAEHIRVFIENGDIECLDSSVSSNAEKHLEQAFPLRTWATIVDWDDLESTTTLAWNQLSDDEAVEWAMTTTAGQCSLGLLLYDGEQPCLVGPLAFMVRHLDELVWGAPGSRILFGVNRDDDGQILFTNGLIEFNGKGELFGTVANQSPTTTDNET